MALGLLKEVAIIQGFPNSSVGKESACNAGETSLVPRRDKLPSPILLGFPDGSAGKESACNVGDLSLIPGSGRSSGEDIGFPLWDSWASLVAQMVKNPPVMQETWVHSLGWEDPLEK